MARFNLFQGSSNKQWYFNLQADNGEKVCQSEGYSSKDAAKKGIDAVKRLAPSAVVVDPSAGVGLLSR